MFKKFGMLALTLVCGLVAGETQAQCGGMYGAGYGLGYWDIGRLYQVLSQNVPYYAAFPPVYYSVPVPRTYGYSPFAYPPGTMTPEVVEAVSAQEIANPYIEPASIRSEAKPQSDRVTQVEVPSRPLVVSNPFVRPVVQTAAVGR